MINGQKNQDKVSSEEKVINIDEKILKQGKKEKNVMRKKIYVDTPLRIFILVGVIVFFAMLSIISLKNALETKTYSSIYYNEKSGVDYRVYIKDNPYFTDKEYLEKGQQYIASIIDYVDADFTYNFNASSYIDAEYRYLIKADVIVHERGDASKVLYKKTDTLVPEKTINKDNFNNYTIKENVKINYVGYNNLVSNFKKDYSLSLESQVKVSLYVFMKGSSDNVEQELSSAQTMSLSMPLTEQTINIGMDYKAVNDTSIVEEYSNIETINIIYLVVFAVSLITALIFTVMLIRFINKIQVKGTEYDRQLGRILKDYEGIVARVKKVPDFNGRTVIELESFDEILDISEKLDKPILFLEMHKHQKSWFLVVNHNEIYKYALKLVDVDKANLGK